MRLLHAAIYSPILLFCLCSRVWAQESPEFDPVKVKQIDDYSEISDDFWSHGSYGDWLLANGRSTFTVGGVPANPGEYNHVRQGALLDVFATPSDPETFQLLQPTTDNRGEGLTFLTTSISTTKDDENTTATIVVEGEHRNQPELKFRTLYSLRSTWPGVLAETRIVNTAETERTLPIVGDYVAWGAMNAFVSGSGFSDKAGVVTDCEFVFGTIFDSYIFIKPLKGFFEYQRSQLSSIMVYAKDLKLAPGQSVTYRRWILTGLNDPSKLNEFTLRQESREFGVIAGRIQEQVTTDDGRVVNSGIVPNAEVRIQVVKRADLPKDYLLRPYIIARTDNNGEFRIALPPGEYAASAFTPSRASEPPRFSTHVEKGKTSAIELAVSRASTLVYEVYDKATGKPIPAKLSLVPLRGTADPNLGPPGSLVSGNAVYTLSGKGLVEVPVGDYRVVASHGNEYHTQERRVRVKQLESQSIRFELERAFDTNGWASADIGVQTNNSPHSRTTPEDRIVTALAEGLDWIVSADLNTVTDLSTAVAGLNVADKIKTSQGIRFTSTAEQLRGSYLLFPTELCSTGAGVDFGRLDQTETPQEAIGLMRSLCPEAVVVAYRPIFPAVGLLSVQGYDFQTRNFPRDREIYAEGVDGFQIWEGKRQLVIDQTIQAYYGLLGSEAPGLVPVANSLSSGTFNDEPGYPRIYIRSDEENPAKLDPRKLAQSIKEGRVIVTNGPFINFRVNGAEIGETITDTDGSVDVELEVFAPNWANVAEISVNANGFFQRRFVLPAGSVDPLARRIHPKPDEDDKVRFNLSISQDSILNIEVKGDVSLLQDPVNPLSIPTSDPTVPRGQYSFALSGGIFVDADGDGIVTPALSGFRTTQDPGQVVPGVPEF